MYLSTYRNAIIRLASKYTYGLLVLACLDLSFDQHVSDVVRSCNYHISSLRHIRPLIDRETAVNLACSIVASRLDYCNSVSYGISEINIVKL